MSKKEIFSENMINRLGIIQGWKAIGRHIGRSGRTARRWYDNYKMPVRNAITGRPFAFIHELDLWMVKVDELLKKEYQDERERLRQHAAMIGNCKKK